MYEPALFTQAPVFVQEGHIFHKNRIHGAGAGVANNKISTVFTGI